MRYMTENCTQLFRILKSTLLTISGVFIASLLNCDNAPIVRVLIVGSMLAAQYLLNYDINRAKKYLLSIYALGLSISLIVGNHIHWGGYHVPIDETYIIPYTVYDAVILVIAFYGIRHLIISLSVIILQSKSFGCSLYCGSISKEKCRRLFLIIFLCWIPYLLTYWPAMFCNDAIASIEQVLGFRAYNNHHPIIYTLFIKFCFFLGDFFPGENHNAGLVIYSLFQMCFLSYCFSYMIGWISDRLKLRELVTFILTIIFGTTPYIAMYGVATWKDPMFSAALVVISLYLADFALSKGDICTGKWLFRFFMFLLVGVFFRNNGIYIIILLLFFVFAFMIISDEIEKSKYRRLVYTLLFTILIYSVVTGPVYRKAGVIEEKVEGVGLLLNQMARVVVVNGDLSEDDKQYMNALLPIELYADAYEPTNIDHLKWYAGFNAEPLNDHFMQHWFSIFIKNPVIYFEAWELETFGYWTINRPEAINNANNIGAAWPVNLNPGLHNIDRLNIECKNLLGDWATSIFVANERSVPLGFLTWGLGFLFIELLFSKRKTLLFSIIPSLGLMATLFIAAPMFYWPRYGAAAQFLVPYFLAILVILNADNMTTYER